MTRLHFACLIAGVLLAATSLWVEAQQPRVPKIGVLSLDFPRGSTCVDEIRLGLAELGYVEGRTYVIEPRWAEDRSERLPSLAADLVRLNVDLIVSASGPAAAIAKPRLHRFPSCWHRASTRLNLASSPVSIVRVATLPASLTLRPSSWQNECNSSRNCFQARHGLLFFGSLGDCMTSS